MPTSPNGPIRPAPIVAIWVLLLLPTVCAAGGKADNPYKLHLSDSGDYHLRSIEGTGSDFTVPAALAAKPYAKEIEAAARANRLDPVLVHALIHAESRHRSDALSDKGAIGLMQILPATALRFGITKPEQVRANLQAGTRYLRQLIDRYDGNLELALAAYNAGEGSVDKYRGVPPYAETQAYVPAVLDTYYAWRGRPQIHYFHGNNM